MKERFAICTLKSSVDTVTPESNVVKLAILDSLIMAVLNEALMDRRLTSSIIL